MLEYEVCQNSNLNQISYFHKLLAVNKTELLSVTINLLLKKQHCKSKQTAWNIWFLLFIQYSCTKWSMWFSSCQNATVQFNIVCSLISSAVWYCLHSFILFFLFNLNCASTSLYILKLEHALLILYFLHHIVIKSDDIFKKRHLLWIWCHHDI